MLGDGLEAPDVSLEHFRAFLHADEVLLDELVDQIVLIKQDQVDDVV